MIAVMCGGLVLDQLFNIHTLIEIIPQVSLEVQPRVLEYLFPPGLGTTAVVGHIDLL